MPLSVRNQIPGTVKEVKLGAGNGRDHCRRWVAVISSFQPSLKDAAEDLSLKAGDQVTVLVKINIGYDSKIILNAEKRLDFRANEKPK